MNDADQRYANVYTAAATAGWAPADLTALGFPPGTSIAGRPRRASRPVTPTQRTEQDPPAPQPDAALPAAEPTDDLTSER